jgi:hypothetical protein
LLGSDRAAQQIAAEAAGSGAPRPEIVLELALGALSRRDFAGALEYSRREVDDGHSLSAGELSLFVYLLAKNDRLAEASKLIASLDPAQVPSIRGFREWFDAKFGPSATASDATRTDARLDISAR